MTTRPQVRPLRSSELVARSRDEGVWQDFVLGLAALGGFHGLHIRNSHGALEGLHSGGRDFPRRADHDDAYGWPDLVLVHPERGLMLLPELKPSLQAWRQTPRARREAQARWRTWLAEVREVQTGVWLPSDRPEIERLLLGRHS